MVPDLPGIVIDSIISTDIECYGDSIGTATVTVSSGSPPYTYQWNDSQSQTMATATGLCAGTVGVTVTDSAGCTVSDTVAISEPTILTTDRKSTRLNSSHIPLSRMPSSA